MILTRKILAGFAAAVSTTVASAALAFAQAPQDEVAPIVYRGATLIDGTGAPARAGMAIVIRGERIEAVVPDDELEALPGAKVVDASGLYVVPGLIDTHVHLATPPDLPRAKALMRRSLYAGVTAERDMADDLRAIGELAREARVGEIPAPDLYYAALMAGPSFFADPRTIAISQGAVPGKVPWAQAIDAATDLPLAVARAKGTYATAIKIYANLPAERVAAITSEAHRQGMKVWAHAAVFPALPEDVARAGVDAMSHACYLAYQVTAGPPSTYQQPKPADTAPFAHGDNAEIARLLQLMKRKNIILDATVRVYVEQEKQYAADPKGRPPRCPAWLAVALTRQAYRAGIPISAGTDGETPRADPWPALFEEMDILQKQVGMAPMDVLRAATSVAARALGQDSSMGTVEPGKLANLVFLARDPLHDIDNIKSVTFTIKRGRRYDRADFKPIAAEEMRDEN